jgi:hypothetical protein
MAFSVTPASVTANPGCSVLLPVLGKLVCVLHGTKSVQIVTPLQPLSLLVCVVGS